LNGSENRKKEEKNKVERTEDPKDDHVNEEILVADFPRGHHQESADDHCDHHVDNELGLFHCLQKFADGKCWLR